MTTQQLKEMTKGMNPAQFEEFLTQNGIESEWMEICITNPNEGTYHVHLMEQNVGVTAWNGSEVEFLD